MKTIFRVLLAIGVCATSGYSKTRSCLILPSFESALTQEHIPQTLELLSVENDSSFLVQNLTDVTVGWLNINLDNSSYASINVTGSGYFSINLINSPVECTIHGQSFIINNPTRIYIDLHTSVRATWTGNIVVLDEKESF